MSQSTALARKVKPLSANERTTLLRIESTLRQKMSSFIEVGNLLLQIREEKLYREEYGSFEVYLEERWDLGRSHGYRLMKAAKVVNALPDDVDKPTTVNAALNPKVVEASEPQETPETEPTVESSVEPHDDPAVERARANGHIPPDVNVEVTHPERADEPEPQEIPEPTDEDWLNTLPARAKLAGLIRDRFDAEALAYRSLESAREAYRTACRKVTKPLAADMRHIGPWLSKHTLHFRIDDPADWQVCADCHGTGFHPLLKEQCPSCKGNGYHV